MSGRAHRYEVRLEWTGNVGTGTSGYRAYERKHELTTEGKPPIPGSSDPVFRGDGTRWNPEDLLVAALSACHQLSYLHLCADAKIVVTAYEDRAEGVMVEDDRGGGRFERAVLRPVVTVAPGGDVERARALHHEAHERCFIASSVNFPVACEPTIRVEGGPEGAGSPPLAAASLASS
jgi:organic hydroperoxide reductase OsmC/OhrA